MSSSAAIRDSGGQAKHLLALDGLRGVAAFEDLLLHRRLWAPGGHMLDHAYLAVDFLFILSGLVIDHAYTERLKGGMTFGDYAMKRALRLYPLIFLGVLIEFPLMLTKVGPARAIAALPLALLVIPAWRLLPMPFAMNRPTWSLFFEFLASYAFGGFGYRLKDRTLTLIAVCAGMAFVVGAHRTGTADVGYQFKTLVWGVPRVIFSFSIGMLINRFRKLRPPESLPFWLVAAILLATFTPRSPMRAEVPYDLFMIMGAYPVLIYGSCGEQPSGWWAKAATFSAFLSYPIYAIHYPVYDWLERVLPNRLGPRRLLIAVPVIAALAVAAGRADEWIRRPAKPARRPRIMIDPPAVPYKPRAQDTIREVEL